jgi:hypothetical protein
MKSSIMVLQTFLVIFLFVFSASTVRAEYEPNTNYTSIGVNNYATKFETRTCLTNGVATECHSGVAGASASASFQIIPNIAISYSGSTAWSNSTYTSISSSGSALFLTAIVGLGSYVDVGAGVGSLSSSTKYCGSSCVTTSDTGSDVGVFGKVWLSEGKRVNLGLAYESFSYSKSVIKYTATSLSLGILPAANHEIDIVAGGVSDSNGYAVSSNFSVGYKYLFDHGRPANYPKPKDEIKPENAAIKNSAAEKLRELNKLKNEGLISEADFLLKKKQILEQY